MIYFIALRNYDSLLIYYILGKGINKKIFDSGSSRRRSIRMTSARVPYFSLRTSGILFGPCSRNDWNRVVGDDTIHEFI